MAESQGQLFPSLNPEAQKASAEAFSKAQNAPQVKTLNSVKYYLPYNGACFIMPSGKRLVFANGYYETNIQQEIDEIEKAIESGAEISRTPMLVVKSDAVLMRDVGASSKGLSGGSTGMVNSVTIAALALESSGKR